MAKQQAAQKQQKASQQEGPSTGTMSRGGKARSIEQQTGERDENYNLISVIYHSLQGAETVSKYLADSRQAGEEDLHAFMQDVQRSYRELAQRGKMLLAERLDTGEEDDEEEEHGDEEEEED
jgi:hypothetical protein